MTPLDPEIFMQSIYEPGLRARKPLHGAPRHELHTFICALQFFENQKGLIDLREKSFTALCHPMSSV